MSIQNNWTYTNRELKRGRKQQSSDENLEKKNNNNKEEEEEKVKEVK